MHIISEVSDLAYWQSMALLSATTQSQFTSKKKTKPKNYGMIFQWFYSMDQQEGDNAKRLLLFL